jgi:tetratricopeptide (TPR) repeat protein
LAVHVWQYLCEDVPRLLIAVVLQKSAKMWMGEASVHYNAKRYQDAIAACDHALEANPDYAWAYSLKGLSYYGLKEYTKALENYDRALELDPQ